MAWLYRREDSRFWWIGWRKPDGKPCFKSTKCKDKADALKQLAQAEALQAAQASGASLDAVYESLAQRSCPRITATAALAKWIKDCEPCTAADTLGRYQLIADAFSAHLGAGSEGPMLDEVSTEQVRDFLTQRWATRNTSTLNLERKILSVFFIRFLKSGHLKSNPVAGVSAYKKRPEERRSSRRAFSVAEVERFSPSAPMTFGATW